jgi:hypothetical protein
MSPVRKTLLATAGAACLLAVAPGAALATSSSSIKGETASSITDTNATLEAQIDPEGLDTSYEFYLEYPSCFSEGPGFCEASGGTEIASGTIPAGSSTQTVSEDVAAVLGHSLVPDTTYGYRVLASNSAGTSSSGLHAFTTLPGTVPVIESVSVSHLTRTDATLEATIDTEGLGTSYEFTMWNSPCSKKGAGCELIREIQLPSGGGLYGSFAPQTVSLDLNAAGVTLGEGEYGFSVRATNAAGSTSADGGVFEAPEPVATPQTQQPGGTPPPSSDSNQLGTSSTTSTGSGGSSSTPIGTPLLAPLGKTIEPKALRNAQKLSRALQACEKKPKGKRAACKKQARKQYRTATKYDVGIKKTAVRGKK